MLLSTPSGLESPKNVENPISWRQKSAIGPATTMGPRSTKDSFVALLYSYRNVSARTLGDWLRQFAFMPSHQMLRHLVHVSRSMQGRPAWCCRFKKGTDQISNLFVDVSNIFHNNHCSLLQPPSICCRLFSSKLRI